MYSGMRVTAVYSSCRVWSQGPVQWDRKECARMCSGKRWKGEERVRGHVPENAHHGGLY